MCSTRDAQIAKISAAIDEIAAAARGGATGQSGATGQADVTGLAARLAGIWAMIAELDPALAARLCGYFPDTG